MSKVERPPSEDCRCTKCRKVFSTLAAFDLHREAPKGRPMDLRCVDPADVPGLDWHVGRRRWGLVADVSPEWFGPFEQLEISLPKQRTRKK